MDLRLIRNIEACQCLPHSEQLVLQISDDNYKLQDFQGQKLTLLNILENSRKEVAPTIKKYGFVEIRDVSFNDELLYFISAKMSREDALLVSLYRYNIPMDIAENLYSFEAPLDYFTHRNTLTVFILDDSYAFIQVYEKKTGKSCRNALLSMEDGTMAEIRDMLFAQEGIADIVHLNQNIYAMRIGKREERLIVVNIKQFISDLLLEKENVTMDFIDESEGSKIYPYMKAVNGTLIYSRFYLSDNREEIVFYDWENKSLKIRMSLSDGESSSRENAYMIGDIPYMLDYNQGHFVLINLNSQTEEFSFEPDMEVKFIYNDLVVVQQQQQKGLLKRTVNYVCAYVLPDMEQPIFKEKGQYAGCIVNNEELLIFSN